MDTEAGKEGDRGAKSHATSPSRRNSVDSSAPAAGHSGKHPAPSPASGSVAAASQSKRKRGPGIVTANACTECRKKRAKCDGQTPCGRCKMHKDTECVYEAPVRQSKENLRAEIDQLRRQQHSSESVLAALAQPAQWEEVLRRLRAGQSVESISEWLGGSLPSGGGATLPSAFGRQQQLAGSHGGQGAYSPGGNYGLGPDTDSPVSSGQGPPPQPQLSTLRQELDPHGRESHHRGPRHSESHSPWHSAQSQPTSAQSETQADAMSWTTERVGAQSAWRVGSWIETIMDGRQSQRPPAHAPHHQQGPLPPPPPLLPPRPMSHSPRPVSASYRGEDKAFAPPELPEMKIPAEMWTDITSDSYLVQHLLSLYFCWEYPTFASLSKEHFLKDFQDGRQRYCSPILVNALLALGCRFSSQPNTRANPADHYTSGDHFFQESQRLFYLEDNHHTLTTIQALGIMSIREASCGRDSESWFYAGQSIRLAIEMGLHRINDDRGDEDEIAVQAATFWGAFALDHAWSLATGSLPQSSCFPHLPPKPGLIDDVEASLWIPYTDDGIPLQRSCEQPSNVRSVYKCFCELSELVHQSLYILHSPGRPLTSRDLLNIYTQYLNWYDKIPEVLRLGHNFTPAVLFAHMYYHFAILLLFRPLIKLRIIGSSISPRDVCAQAADAIQGLSRSYSQLYTLRRTPSFVPYFVLTSSIMHLAIGASKAQGPSAEGGGDGKLGADAAGANSSSVKMGVKMEPRVKEAINQGIADLTEMAPCHHFADQALSILRFLAKKWNIDVDIEQLNKSEGRGGSGALGTGPAASGPTSPKTADELALAARDRERSESLVRPTTHSRNFFSPNMGDTDFMCSWGSPALGVSGAVDATPDIAPNAPAQAPPSQDESAPGRPAATVENPLFWPFPMQGRPMLPSGRQLREAGFELL